MSSVAKDKEILTAIPDTSESPARPQPVALEVPVTVNGVRTVAGSEKREPFSESTKTVLIFGHGAVVRLASSVAPGQLVFLTNEKTKREVVCQVVKSRNYQHVSGYVELEFTEPIANFWGMRFPASAPTASAPTARVATETTAMAAAASTTAASNGTAGRSVVGVTAKDLPSQPDPKSGTSTPFKTSSTAAVESTVAHVAAPNSQQSPGIAPQNNTRALIAPPSPAGSGSRGEKSSNVVEIFRAKSAKTELATPEIAHPAPKNSPVLKSILDEGEVKIPSWLEPLARNAAAASAIAPEGAGEPAIEEYADAVVVEDPAPAEAAKSTELSERAVPTSSYGTHFLADDQDRSAATKSGGGDKKLLIVGIAAAVLLLAGGGAWYVQQQRANGNSVNAAAPVNTVAPASAGTEAASSVPSQQPDSSVAPSGNFSATTSAGNVNVEATSSPAPVTPAPRTITVDSATSNPSLNANNKKLATVDEAPEAAPIAKKPSLGIVSLSAPIVKNRSNGQERTETLNLESSAVLPVEDLGSGLVSNTKQPLAPIAPRPVGGDVKVAKLLSSVAPLYPANAKAQKVDGDVKIDALIGANGRVSSMKIVSGPTLLRDPAMDAVRHWKYQAAELDGKAVASHLNVTVQFKLQD
jgi:TonB family protein